MTAGFGGAGYTTPQTRTLNAISETPVPDAADLSDASKVAQLLQTHTYQLKELADGQKQLQAGVNDATQNPIQQIQQFLSDIIVLFGGGEITSGLLDFGDLQYILPTLGALFGLGDGPFPINLFEAAEKFFLGYVVPSQQFADEINTIISNWMTTLGFDPKFIKDLKALITSLGDLFGSLGNLIPSLDQFFSALGLDGGDLGPLGQILGPIIKLFSGIDLTNVGSMLEFITTAIDPFIVQLTAIINFIDSVLAIIGFHGDGGVVNSPIGDLTSPIQQLMDFLSGLLSVFGLGSADGDSGLGLGNLLSLPTTFLNDLLGGLGLGGNISDGAGPLVTLISDLLSGNIQGVIDTLLGFLSGGSTTTGNLDDLSGLLNNIPLIGTLIDALGGSGTGMGGIVAAIESLPQDAESLFGFLSPNLFSQVNIGALTTTAPNLLPAPTFAADSIAPNSEWSVDSTASRTADGTGAARLVADGRYHALRSGSGPNDRIPVSAGQTVTGTIFCSHQGYSGVGGPPIQLQVVPFTGDVQGTPVALDTYAPAAADVAWPGHQLTGSYVVADGVTAVQERILVTDGALAGVLLFDDGAAQQTGTISQDSVSGLPDVLSFINGTVHTGFDAIASAARGLPVVGAEIADVVTAIENFDPLNALGTLGPTNLSGDLFGIVGSLIDAVTGQPHGTTTAGSLADLYNAMNQAINNTSNEDVTTFYDTTTTAPIESWADQLDLIGMGEGQDGEDGLIFNFFGQGGQAGKVNATSLLRGTHYDSGTTHIAITVNSDGSIVLAVPAGTSTSAQSITAAKGSGSQSPHFGAGFMGIGPGPFTYNGKTYAGGGNQNTSGAAGVGPAGGGAGGNGTFFQRGGPGAPAGGWVRQLATPISGGSTGVDTTAPTGGTGSVLSATDSTITVSASGSVDA